MQRPVQGVGPRAYGAAMLREVADAAFSRRLTPLGWRYEASWDAAPAWGTRRFRALQARQTAEPVALHARRAAALVAVRGPGLLGGRGAVGGRRPRAGPRARAARPPPARARARRRRRGARAARRQPIPAELRRAVWERDGGACTGCGAQFDLQYDHVIPVALGGATTAANLQVLCAPCNRRKGAALG